jgi:hypothetical protein
VYVFFILVTLDLGIILIPFIYLFRFSTRFEQICAHHQEIQLYQYIWYMSLCVGDRIDTIDSSDDEHKVALNM